MKNKFEDIVSKRQSMLEGDEDFGRKYKRIRVMGGLRGELTFFKNLISPAFTEEETSEQRLEGGERVSQENI